jgi:hypothetical protein
MEDDGFVMGLGSFRENFNLPPKFSDSQQSETQSLQFWLRGVFWRY